MAAMATREVATRVVEIAPRPDHQRCRKTAQLWPRDRERLGLPFVSDGIIAMEDSVKAKPNYKPEVQLGMTNKSPLVAGLCSGGCI
jgi:hypothetical protein